MIRAILFDMDGTVLDSEKIYLRSWRQAAAEIRFEGDIAEHLPYLSGMNGQDIGRYFCERFGEGFPFEKLLEERNKFLNEIIRQEGIPVKPGVPEVFDRLHGQSCLVALVTSANRKRLEQFMGHTKLTPYFDLIVTGDTVAHSKPQPDIFLFAAQELNCLPEKCVVCEDSRNGIYAGYRAGMRVIMIPDLQPVTDELTPLLWKTCTTLAEVPELIAQENHTN